MTHEEKGIAMDAVLQPVFERGFDGMQEAPSTILNVALRLEREKALGAAPHERTEERRGYANGFKPKALKRARAKVRDMTDKRQCFPPVPERIVRINRHLIGWANYYAYGYPRKAFRDMNHYVCVRVIKHLDRRSNVRTSGRKVRPTISI